MEEEFGHTGVQPPQLPLTSQPWGQPLTFIITLALLTILSASSAYTKVIHWLINPGGDNLRLISIANVLMNVKG